MESHVTDTSDKPDMLTCATASWLISRGTGENRFFLERPNLAHFCRAIEKSMVLTSSADVRLPRVSR